MASRILPSLFLYTDPKEPKICDIMFCILLDEENLATILLVEYFMIFWRQYVITTELLSNTAKYFSILNYILLNLFSLLENVNYKTRVLYA